MVRAAAVLAALPFLNDRSGVFALSKRQRFQELSTQGQDAIILGDLPAANVSLTEALALKPSSSKTANDLGVVLLQWAIEEETSATRADPTSVHAKLEQAQTVLSSALRRVDGNPKKQSVARTLKANLVEVEEKMAAVQEKALRVLHFRENRPPELPRIRLDQLMDRSDKFFDGRLPFVLVPNSTDTARALQAAQNQLTAAAFAKRFPTSIVDAYFRNMDSIAKKPYLTPLHEAARLFYQHVKASDAEHVPYLQWRAPLDEWQVLERDDFGMYVPDWFRTDAAWFPQCLGSKAGDESGSDFLDVVGNFMASQHWSVVSMGTTGSGMFFHPDGIATSTYHLQLVGKKKWFVCPPQRSEDAQYGVNFLQFSAGDVDTFDPGQWVPLYPEFADSVQECTETIVRPGELLYYPTGWWHQTLNMDGETVGLAARRVDRHNYIKVFHSIARKCAGECNDISKEFPGAAPCLTAAACERWVGSCLHHWQNELFSDAFSGPERDRGRIEKRTIEEQVPRRRPNRVDLRQSDNVGSVQSQHEL